MRFFLWACLVAGVALSLNVSYDIARQDVIVGAREGRWFYFYIQPFSLQAILVWAAATALCLGLLHASEIVGRRNEWLVVLMWLAAAVVIEGLICSLAPFRLQKIFESDGANSFNTVAQRYTPATMLGDFERVRKYWPPHGQSNMPGKAILVYWLRQITKRTDVLPWLVLVVSNIGGVLLYGLVRDLFERRTALYALVLYVIVPARMFFFPLLNVVTPIPTILSAWLLVRWLKTGNVIYAVLFGASIYVLALWEPTGLVIGLLFSALIVAAWSRGSIRTSTLAWQAVAIVVSFGLVYWGMFVRYHFNLLPAVRLLAAEAAKFNVDTLRPYNVWIRQNLWDFLFGVGVCPAILAAGALPDGLFQSSGGLRRLSEPIVVVVLGLASVVIATDLIGVNRGEVVRLWIFLACFAQIPAAYVCARLDSRWAVAIVVAVTLLHDALGTDMIGFILPG